VFCVNPNKNLPKIHPKLIGSFFILSRGEQTKTHMNLPTENL